MSKYIRLVNTGPFPTLQVLFGTFWKKLAHYGVTDYKVITKQSFIILLYYLIALRCISVHTYHLSTFVV